MTKKELIEESICKMDSEKLKQFLSDENTYNDYFDKEHFVEILEEEVFAEFRKNGDTFLEPFSGKCQRDCCDNRHYKGIAFVGNNSKDVINIIFKEKEKEKRIY